MVTFGLDGETIAGGDGAPEHLEVELSTAAIDALKDGKPHRLTATCQSEVGPASVSAVLELEYEDGRVERIETDRWWRKAGTKERASVVRSYAAPAWLEAWLDGEGGSPDDGPPGEEDPSVRRTSGDR